MKLTKKIILKVLSVIPTRISIFIIDILLQAKSEKLAPLNALKFLFEIENKLYGLEGRNAIRYDGGIHSKHRLMNYHAFFIGNILAGSTVLDIGCGSGALASDIANTVKNVKLVGIDLDKQNIQIAEKKYQGANINFILGDATIDLPAKTFDIIILSNVLEHIEKRIEFLCRLNKQYVPKAFLIRVPLFDRDWRVPLKKEIGVDYRLDVTHYIEYTFEEFQAEMNQSGLMIRSYDINWGEIWAVVVQCC